MVAKKSEPVTEQEYRAVADYFVSYMHKDENGFGKIYAHFSESDYTGTNHFHIIDEEIYEIMKRIEEESWS